MFFRQLQHLRHQARNLKIPSSVRKISVQDSDGPQTDWNSISTCDAPQSINQHRNGRPREEIHSEGIHSMKLKAGARERRMDDEMEDSSRFWWLNKAMIAQAWRHVGAPSIINSRTTKWKLKASESRDFGIERSTRILIAISTRTAGRYAWKWSQLKRQLIIDVHNWFTRSGVISRFRQMVH